MSKLLIISLSSLKHDARVKRQIYFLKDNYQLTVACFEALDVPNIKFVKLEPPIHGFSKKLLIGSLLLLRCFKIANRLLHSYPQLNFQKENFDLIIANDIECLPIAFEIKGNSKILFDAHEYFPRQFEDKFAWRILFQPMNKYLCSKYLNKVNAMTTIGEGIANEYERVFNVKPIVVNNAASFTKIEPIVSTEQVINLVHHGIAIPSRRLELMIEMMAHLDERFYLNLMLISPQTANQKTRNYFLWLKEIAKNNPRIKFIDPVKTDEIVSTINKYDIGVILVPPINFNYKNGLGNKFFDFIQARLAMAIGPIPEMAKMAKQFNLGVVSKDFTPESLAKEINGLSAERINLFKKNAAKAALEISADKNKIIVNEIVSQLLA